MTDIEIRRHKSAASFLNTSLEWLMEDELANNEIIAMANLVVCSDHHYKKPIYLASIHNSTGICGCGVQALPDSFTISDMPRTAIEPLLLDRHSAAESIGWLTADNELAERFGRAWERSLGATWSIKNRWLVQAASKTSFDSCSVSGRIRVASDRDRPLILDWGNRYAIESPSPIDIPQFMNRKLIEGNLFIWDDNGAQMMIAISGRTENVARISAVYTPIESRGNGFARAGVAAVTQRLLDSGLALCTLVTDESKSKLAELYSSVGYSAVAKRTSINLAAPL